MPIYEYRCERCGAVFDALQKMSDEPLSECRICGEGPVTKLVSQSAFQLKGSGWYVTDYARKASSKNGSSKKDTKGEAATTEAAKPAATSTGKSD